MKIVFITPTPPDLNAFGVRGLSALLKRAGHATRIVFLPGGIEHLRFDAGYVYRYSPRVLGQLADLCADADLLGISFMSLYFDRAVQVTDFLRERLGKPVAWGGTHPTFRPEECLRHCDMVGLGECDLTLPDLVGRMARGEEYRTTPGFWFRDDGGIRRNEPGPLPQDLDTLPFPDYDLADHFVFDWREDAVVPLDAERMRRQFLRLPYFRGRQLITYRTMSSRGCPHKCSYCASASMLRMRRRSVDNTLAELESIRGRFPYVEAVSFFDDTFFASPLSYFTEFREQYRRRIGLPFHAQCSPTTLSEAKLELLLDAGLYWTEMGLQTGSARIRELYRRNETNARMIEAATLLRRHRRRLLPPDYHVILDNPWETPHDVRDTLNLLLQLPGPYGLQISSLVLFPGTELNDRARAEGLLHDELSEVCRKPFTFPQANYLNYLIYLAGFTWIPRGWLRRLAGDAWVARLHRPGSARIWAAAFALSQRVRRLGRGIGALLRGDWRRILNHFRLVR